MSAVKALWPVDTSRPVDIRVAAVLGISQSLSASKLNRKSRPSFEQQGGRTCEGLDAGDPVEAGADESAQWPVLKPADRQFASLDRPHPQWPRVFRKPLSLKPVNNLPANV